jgi:hypothetical protein
MATGRITERKVAWIGIGVMGVMSLLYLLVPTLRLQMQDSLLPNEGWNAQQSVQALSGGVLYPTNDSFWFNNYPPLSFYIVGLIGSGIGDYILAGRLISLVAILTIAANIALTVRNLGGTLLFGVLAGVFFIGTLAKSYVNYVGVDEPQLLAHAVMTTGFVIFTASPRSSRHIAFAALVMATAGFIKQNIFAMPLAATTWLLQTDRRAFAYWFSFSLGILILGFAAAGEIYGPAFFEQMLYPRTYRLYNVLGLLGWLQNFIVPLVLWIIFARGAPREPRIQLVNHLVVAGGIAFVVTRLADNVSINSLFDWVIGTSIAVGVMLSRVDEARLSRRYGPDLTRGLIVGALCLRMILLPQTELINLLLNKESWFEYRTSNAAFRRDIAFMQNHQGPAICEDLALCHRSGHQSEYDAIGNEGAFQLGVRNIDVLRQQIATGQYPLIQLNGPSSPLFVAARAASLKEQPGASGVIIFYK